MSHDELLTRASGRARFCRDKGGVKTPDLLDQLSARIREQDAAIAELVEALDKTRHLVADAAVTGLTTENLFLNNATLSALIAKHKAGK